jgi:oxygen-independent coproporphyrinogen-3 oxidase
MTDTAAQPAWLWPDAAYIHVPFCAHHCGYCDFAVSVGRDDQIERYIDALHAELAIMEQPQPVRTLFLGGGTPTHLGADQLERLLAGVLRWLPLRSGHEFSVEANPGTLTAEKIDVLAAHGVNRVSLGAQSFQPHLLQVLERDHQPADVPAAVARIRDKIEVFSLDLIFGVPGQSLDDWHSDVRQVLALEPDHVSTYGLTYEKGTRLWKQKRHGQVQPLEEDDELAMYLSGMETLAAAGFEHYEISNFAKSGKRCRHNLVYWANHAYFGFGMGAARYVQGRRELNTRDLMTYMQRTLARQAPTFQTEQLIGEEQARETISLNLRRAEGMDRAAFRRRTGFDLDALTGDVIGRCVALGLLVDDAAGVRLTRQGKCVADAVIQQFWKGPNA